MITNPDTYGLTTENPLKLNSFDSARIMFQNLVTMEGYHILYHKFRTLKFLNLELYQIYDSEKDLITNIYVDIQNKVPVWIPPANFQFEHLHLIQLYAEDDEYRFDIETEVAPIYPDSQYVNTVRENWTVDDYGKVSPDSMQNILYRSWGVDYKMDNFPHDVYDIFEFNHTDRYEQLSQEEKDEFSKKKVNNLLHKVRIYMSLN